MHSPGVLRKVVYAGSNATSFQQAATMLRELAGLRVSPKQVERACHRIGAERLAERQTELEAFRQLPFEERVAAAGNANGVVPALAVVEMDGGRLQTREADEHASRWREDKVGVLWTAASDVTEQDPCPTIPAVFVDPTGALRLAQEIGGRAVPEGMPEASADTATGEEAATRPGRPELLVRSVVASQATVDAFGPLLAQAAHARNFAACSRQAFIGDGSEANWTVQKTWFARYTPVLDFVHALTYIYAAATAGRPFAAGWPVYTEWIGQLWRGEVTELLAALRQRLAELGVAPEDEPSESPRRVVQEALGYLENHRAYLRYAEYRKAGLPITSSQAESTIKRINQRLKGSEKFWSVAGAEALLQLRADYLSDTEPMSAFWQRRAARQTGFRPYQDRAA
jgi:hypothetical protein